MRDAIEWIIAMTFSMIVFLLLLVTFALLATYINPIIVFTLMFVSFFVSLYLSVKVKDWISGIKWQQKNK